MAFDILTILVSSVDCERMFTELGDLLEARRMKMRPQPISAKAGSQVQRPMQP